MFFAIPYFKNPLYLEETLRSLILQDDAEWTALVLDDSIDPSAFAEARSCVEKLKDSRIRYHRNEKNLGMAVNWNQAFDLAKEQELLVILHADDRLKSDYVREMKTFAQKNPEASAYFCKTEIIGALGLPVFSFADVYKNTLLPKTEVIKLRGISGIEKLIPGNFIFCPSLCYRVHSLSGERFRPDLKMVTDFEFMLRSLLAGHLWVGFYHHPLFEYRRHSENTTLSLTKNLVRFHEEIALYRDLAKKLGDLGENAISKKASQMKIVKLNLIFEMVNSILKCKFRFFLRTFALFREIL